MYLSEDSKLFLDVMIKNSPDLMNGYFRVDFVIENAKGYKGDYFSAKGVTETLVKQELAKFGDSSRETIRLLEAGRAYKELEGLERKDRWIQRIWGFLAGIATTLIVKALS